MTGLRERADALEIELAEARQQLAALRAALRSRAIAAIPGGYACRLCQAFWPHDATDRHEDGCVLREEGTP